MTTPITPAPRHWSDLDEYLKAAHLPASQPVTVIIERVEFRTLHPRPGQEEIKPVLFFKGKNKGLILTATNQDYLRKTFGDEIAAVAGQVVALRAVSKKIAGRMVDTIIIEPAPPTAK